LCPVARPDGGGTFLMSLAWWAGTREPGSLCQPTVDGATP